MKKKTATIGVDLGGTQVRAGLVESHKVKSIKSKKINAQGSAKEVFRDLCEVIDQVMDKKVKGIGIGVPSLVDQKTGVIHSTTNIPSWKNVSLKKWLEKKYKLPVSLDNDANCFTLGELQFGKSTSKNFIGLILGTGLGAGIVSNGKLHSGQECGAGEFGMFPYLDGILENYASGQFFKKLNENGEDLFKLAQKNDPEALRIFSEYGKHLGEGIKLILFALAPEMIILGGSVSLSYPYFKKALEESLNEFPTKEITKKLKIKVSKTKHGAILGAANLIQD